MTIRTTIACFSLALCVSVQAGAAQTTNDDSNAEPGTMLRESPLSLSRQLDDERPDRQLQLGLFGRPLTIGGEIELRPELRDNLDLNTDLDDELNRVAQKLELEAFYEINTRLYTFAEVKLKARQDTRDDRENRQESGIERGESWLYYVLPGDHLAIQVGRQNFRDRREWWWDNDLDAVRLHFDNGPIEAEVAVARELGNVAFGESLAARDRDISRLIGNMTWQWADRQQLDIFWLQQSDNSGVLDSGSTVLPEDEDDFDANLRWFGVRAEGRVRVRPLGQFYYWADVGNVRGNEVLTNYDDTLNGLRVLNNSLNQKVQGTAFDVGVTWRTELQGELSITIGFAEGSGDNDLNDNRDTSFRQTGLQDNNSKFRGVDRFRYYGELFRPELSNMRIVTFSIGWHLTSDSSLEIVYHDYQQVVARNTIRDSKIDIDPTGLNDDIGQEIDLVLGLEEWQHWEFELVAAAFYAGKAFGARVGEPAYLVNAKVNYNF
jgi:alginate production protein